MADRIHQDGQDESVGGSKAWAGDATQTTLGFELRAIGTWGPDGRPVVTAAFLECKDLFDDRIAAECLEAALAYFSERPGELHPRDLP